MESKRPNYGAARYGPVDVYNLPEDRTVTQHARSSARMFWMIYMVIGWWGCTEFLAWQLNDDRALGKLLTKGVYLPWEWIGWSWTFLRRHYRTAAFSAHVHNAIWMTVCIAVVGFIVSIVLAQRDLKRALQNAPRPPDLRGSAHWASPREIWKMGLLSRPPKGVRRHD